MHDNDPHPNDAGDNGGGGGGDGGEMDVEAAKSYLHGDHHYGGQEDHAAVPAGAAMTLAAPVGGEAGPRVGEDHQAVIPNLSSLGTNCELDFVLCLFLTSASFFAFLRKFFFHEACRLRPRKVAAA